MATSVLLVWLSHIRRLSQERFVRNFVSDGLGHVLGAVMDGTVGRIEPRLNAVRK